MKCMQEMNVIAKISCYLLFLVQCSYTKIAQKIFKYSDIWYPVFLWKKAEQFDIQNVTRKLQTSKNNPVFLAHPVQYTDLAYLHTLQHCYNGTVLTIESKHWLICAMMSDLDLNRI